MRDLAGLLQHRATCGYVQPFKPFLHAEAVDAIVSNIAPEVSTDEVYRAVLSHIGRGLDWIIDKSPSYVSQTDEVLAAFPTAKIIIITRDPRDVLTSEKYWYRHFWATRNEVPHRLIAQHFVQYHPVTMSLLWRSAARVALSATDERIYRVAFEDLIGEPENVLRSLVEWLGEAYEPNMLNVERRGSSNRAGRRDGSGVDPSVRGWWQTGLSRSELWILRKMAYATMREAGYDMTESHPNPLVLACQPVTFAVRMLAAAILNPRRGRALVQHTVSSLGKSSAGAMYPPRSGGLGSDVLHCLRFRINSDRARHFRPNRAGLAYTNRSKGSRA